jgi:hypothetical protein
MKRECSQRRAAPCRCAHLPRQLCLLDGPPGAATTRLPKPDPRPFLFACSLRRNDFGRPRHQPTMLSMGHAHAA